jgi:hypothetical protein
MPPRRSSETPYAGPRRRRGKPERYWRSYGNDLLPTGAESRDEPFAASPTWPTRNQMRPLWKGPDGCGGRAGKVELLTGIGGVTSRPMRRIVLEE